MPKMTKKLKRLIDNYIDIVATKPDEADKILKEIQTSYLDNPAYITERRDAWRNYWKKYLMTNVFGCSFARKCTIPKGADSLFLNG